MNDANDLPEEAVEAFANACGYFLLSLDATEDLKDGLSAAQPVLVRAAVEKERSTCLSHLGLLKAEDLPSGSDAFRAGFRKGVEACLAAIRERQRLH